MIIGALLLYAVCVALKSLRVVYANTVTPIAPLLGKAWWHYVITDFFISLVLAGRCSGVEVSSFSSLQNISFLACFAILYAYLLLLVVRICMFCKCSIRELTSERRGKLFYNLDDPVSL